MKQCLLASCLLLATVCGARQGEKITTTAQPPVAGKELNLTPYGFPVILRVPEGTTATKVSGGKRVEVIGPRYMVEVISEAAADEAKAKEMLKGVREAYAADKGTVVLVDEPLLLYLERTRKDGSKGYMWFRAVYDPAVKKIHLLTETSSAYSDATLTKADHDNMMASARAARLAGK